MISSIIEPLLTALASSWACKKCMGSIGSKNEIRHRRMLLSHVRSVSMHSQSLASHSIYLGDVSEQHLNSAIVSTIICSKHVLIFLYKSALY